MPPYYQIVIQSTFALSQCLTEERVVGKHLKAKRPDADWHSQPQICLSPILASPPHCLSCLSLPSRFGAFTASYWDVHCIMARSYCLTLLSNQDPKEKINSVSAWISLFLALDRSKDPLFYENPAKAKIRHWISIEAFAWLFWTSV